MRLFNPDTKEEVVRRVDARGTFHNFLLLDKDLIEQKSTTVQVYKCSYGKVLIASLMCTQIRVVSSTEVGKYS